MATSRYSALINQRMEAGVCAAGKLSKVDFDNAINTLIAKFGDDKNKMLAQIALDLVSGGPSEKRLRGAEFIFPAEGGGNGMHDDVQLVKKVAASDVYREFFGNKPIVLRQIAMHMSEEVLNAFDAFTSDKGVDPESASKASQHLSVLLPSSAERRIGGRELRGYRGRAIKRMIDDEVASRNDDGSDI